MTTDLAKDQTMATLFRAPERGAERASAESRVI